MTTLGTWAPQGTVIPSVSGDSPQQPNVIFEGNAKILSGNVFKCWFSNNTAALIYAESSNGTSWTRYGSAVIASGVVFPKVTKQGSTYYLYCNPDTSLGSINLYTSTDGITWSGPTTSILTTGTTGTWDAHSIGQLGVLGVIGGTWYGYYFGTSSALPAVYKTGLATSSDGSTWTKSPSNPIFNFGSGNFTFATVGSTYYGWSQISIAGSPGQSNELPCDIARFSATNPSGPWTQLSPTTLYRTTAAEGVENINGQVADPSIVFDGTNTWMFTTSDSTGGATSCVIEGFKAASTTIAQLVQTYEGVQNYPIPNSILTQQLVVLASDNFQRADANPIGGNWSPLSSGNTAQIVSDNVRISTVSSPGDSYWNALSWPNDQWSQITLGTIVGTTSFAGCEVRMDTSGTKSAYRLAWGGAATGSGGTLYLQKQVSGTTTVLQSRSLTANIGDVFTLCAIGSDISAYWNGFLVLAITDTSLTSGAAGFQESSSAAVADANITAWSGGSFQSVPPIPSSSTSAPWYLDQVPQLDVIKRRKGF